jgi:hypothetical protein
VVLAAPQGASGPGIHQVEDQRRVGRNGRVQAGRRLPGPVAHPGHMLAHRAGGLQRNGAAIDGQQEAVIRHAGGPYLQALDGGVDKAHGAADGAFLTHHMPGFEGAAQLDLDAAHGELADLRETELHVRRKPLRLEGQAVGLHVFHDVVEVLLHEMRQQEAVVQLGAPAHQAFGCVGGFPEACQQAAQQELLGQGHARMGRHFEGAQLKQAEAPGGAVRRVELVDAELGAVGVAGDVDQQVAQQAVDQPRRHALADLRELAEGGFDFVHRIVTCFIDARCLAGRADEHAGEQVGQAGVVVPVGDQAAQQVRAPQEGRIGGHGAAEHEVVAAAGAGVATVDHELLAGQARVVGRLVEVGGALHQLFPVAGRVDVHLDHAGVGGDAEVLQARVGGRLVAFQHHRHAEFLGGGFNGGDQFEVLLEAGQGRHEDVHGAVARFGAHGGAHDPVGRLEHLGLAVGGAELFGVAGGLQGCCGAGRGRGAEAGLVVLEGVEHGCLAAGELAADGLVLGQRREGLVAVDGIDVRVVTLGHPGLGIQGQAIAQRGITGIR